MIDNIQIIDIGITKEVERMIDLDTEKINIGTVNLIDISMENMEI